MVNKTLKEKSSEGFSGELMLVDERKTSDGSTDKLAMDKEKLVMNLPMN